MQQMQSINIDKWRKLNKNLFLSYVDCYTNLENNTVNKEDAMMSALFKYDILLKADKSAYSAYYTIAREIGIFFQDTDGNFITSKLTKSVYNGNLSYSDYLKYYVLNTEFLINDKVIHPFSIIITEINKGNNTLEALVDNCSSLITEKNNATKDCLRIFIERIIDAGFISKDKKLYTLEYPYQTLLDSCNYSKLDAKEFSDKYIGNQNYKQENIVKEMIEKPINLSLFNNKDETKIDETIKNNLGMNCPLNQILYGPPGTGKTYTTIKKSLEILGLETGDPSENAEIFRSQLNQRIFFATMHPSYSYEDFVQGMKPETNAEGQLIFKQKDGIFKRVAQKAKLELEKSKIIDKSQRVEFDLVFDYTFSSVIDNNEPLLVERQSANFSIIDINDKRLRFATSNGNSGDTYNISISTLKQIYSEKENNKILSGNKGYYDALLKLLLENESKLADKFSRENNFVEYKQVPYVLILDEINRANISKVFGELITLMEDDKRIGGENEMSILLSSGEEFSVPSNLYIIGTMNTADKSIALVDLALRRRFEFEAMYPDSNIIMDYGKKEQQEKKEFLDAINKQLIEDKGIDFQIGHAYFLKDNTLSDVINKNILPLLVEYFRNDLKKVESFMTKIGYPIVYINGLLQYVN